MNPEGRIPPREGLEFTLTTLGVKAVAIGVASIEEVNQDFQLVKEILHEKGILWEARNEGERVTKSL